jgi:hypothetical protein
VAASDRHAEFRRALSQDFRVLTFTVEFGVKLGGETGIILAKGTAEVNLKITMTWDREPRQVGDASGRV